MQTSVFPRNLRSRGPRSSLQNAIRPGFRRHHTQLSIGVRYRVPGTFLPMRGLAAYRRPLSIAQASPSVRAPGTTRSIPESNQEAEKGLKSRSEAPFADGLGGGTPTPTPVVSQLRPARTANRTVDPAECFLAPLLPLLSRHQSHATRHPKVECFVVPLLPLFLGGTDG